MDIATGFAINEQSYRFEYAVASKREGVFDWPTALYTRKEAEKLIEDITGAFPDPAGNLFVCERQAIFSAWYPIGPDGNT